MNIQGINPKVQKQKIKFSLLKEYISTSENPIPLFVVTETHLKDCVLNAEVNIENYNIIRAERNKRKQGGVAIYHHYMLNMEETETFSNDCCECAMSYNKENSVSIIGVSRPPDATPTVFKECLQNIQSFIDRHPDNSIIILGDFNLKFINWETEKIEKPENIKQPISSDERVCSNLMLEFVSKNLLVQLVTENTRLNKSLLDLVLTNNEDTVQNVKVEKNNIDTDHDTVNLQILLNEFNTLNSNFENATKKPLDKLNFQQANWEEMRSELKAIEWVKIFQNKTVNEMHNLLEENLITASEKHVPPRKKITVKNSIPRNRLRLIRKRKQINTRINLIIHFNHFKDAKEIKKLQSLRKRKAEIEEEMKVLLGEEMLQKELNAINLMKKNPRYFYSYVKKFNKTVNRMGPLQDQQGILINDPTAKANILQIPQLKQISSKINTPKCLATLKMLTRT